MRTARIIEVQGPRWIILNDKMWSMMGDGEPPRLSDKCYHMSLEAAKSKAYDDGYQAYVYGKRVVKFREIRDKRKMRGELL